MYLVFASCISDTLSHTRKVESLMQAFYKHTAAGSPAPDALAQASRQAASLSSHNFVCIGALPTATTTLAARASPVDTDDAGGAAGVAPPAEQHKLSTWKAVERPHATQAFEWGAPSGV